MTVIVFNKPYGVLCQFRDGCGRRTLGDYIDLPAVYPAGRLDKDSEGLVIVTDDGRLQHRIAHPESKLWKTYWVQIEGVPSDCALRRLASGVALADGPTRPARVAVIEEPPGLWSRTPPIRYRARIPTCWIRLATSEGRNRQVRRMTAAVGHPTLRLIRYAVGGATVDGLCPGEWRFAEPVAIDQRFGGRPKRGSWRRHPRSP